MPECDIGTVQDFAAKNDSKIMLAITLKRMLKDPYATVLQNATWTAGEAQSHTVVVGRNAAPADPLDIVMPEFEESANSCGSFPSPDSVGTTEYTYKLHRKKGVGPLVCLYQGIDAFQESYKIAADSLSDLVTLKTQADTRNQLLQLSGLKAVVNNEVDFYDTINGTTYALATPFKPGLVPNTAPTFEYIKKLGQFLTTDLGVPQFEADTTTKGAGVPANIKVIASEELLEKFRAEAEVKESVGFLTAGSFEVGKQQLLTYVWEGPIRGVGFAKDPQPIRLATWPEDGVIRGVNVIPPQLKANLQDGAGNVPNPAYFVGRYEIGFLIGGKDSFVRETLKGSGTIKLGDSSFAFPDQYNSGELKFWVPQGACDAFGEYGFHRYSIVRAIRPQHPHYVMPFGYERCQGVNLPYCASNQL